MTRLAAISVDLDSLPHYCRIHGLDEGVLDDHARGLVAWVAIPRLMALFEEAKVPATFFVIGEDLHDDTLKRALKDAHGRGVELGNHSHSHDYALSRRSEADVEADLRQAHEAITAVTGVAPTGFRAPGYTLTSAMARAVAALGYSYDASAYPAAPYYLLKAGVMGALKVLGRPSRAILDSPRVLAAPRVPYRPDLAQPYRRGAAPFVELPMAVSPRLKLPFIGTLATTLPSPLVDRVVASLADDALVSFELHAIDVLDASDGIPEAVARAQRDVQVKATEKCRRLSRLFSRLAQQREAVTLEQAARRLASVV